jgi:hypothetical protein
MLDAPHRSGMVLPVTAGPLESYGETVAAEPG